MDIQRVVEALNQALAQELAAVVQFYWHNVLATGAASSALRDRWKQMSIAHMRHAEELAERIDHFEGVPTTQPFEIRVGKNLEEMIANDAALQEELVKNYRGYLDICREDPVTRELLTRLLRDEEQFLDEIRSWQGE